MNARSKIKTSVKPARSFKKDLASHGDHSTFIVNMAHHIPDAMIALNNRFTIIGWNAAAEHTFGWKADEAVGKNFNRLLKTKPTVNGKSNPLTIARRMGKWSGEVTRVRKDGVRIWVWSSVSVVRNEEGNPIGFICISRDVTERKRTDEKLRESQAKLASVVNSAMDAMISLDEDQRIILFNPAAESMFGCPAAEAMGQPLDRFIPERFREAHRRHIHAFGQTNQTRRAMGKLGQLTCMRSDGVEFPAEISISQAEVGGRKIYTAILRDITERLEVNESLRTSEARFRTLFENVPVAIWEEDFSEVKRYLDSLKEQGVTDLRGYFASHPEEVIRCEQMIRVLDLNNTAVEMFEAKNKNELLNFTRQTNSKGELEHGPEDLVAIAEGRTSRSWEGSDETMTGRPVQINLSWSVFPGHEQDYSRVIVTTMDITERKLAEEALQTSEKTFHGLFNSVAEAIYIQDADGRFLDVNEGALKMYGHPREFFIGNTPEPLSAPGRNDLNEVAGAVQAAFGGQPQQFEFWGIRSNGEVFPKDVRLYKGTYFGKDVVTALAQDITERKQAEVALLESERRYRVLFEDVPIAVWEEDFSEIKENIDKLKESGITDFHNYFKSHPQEVLRFGRMTRILDLNKAALEMYDAENKEDLIRFIVQSLGSEESSTSYGYLVAISEGKTASSWEGRDKTMAGRIIDVNMAWTVFTGHEQDYSRIIFTTMDVTERKQAEMARGRLSNVLEASLNEIYIFDPDSLRFEYANSGALLNLGYSLEDLKKITPVDLKPEFTEESFKEMLDPLLRREKERRIFQTIHRRADGSLYPVEVHLQLVESAGIHAFLAVIIDITERKQAEDSLTRRLTELELLYQSGLALSSELDPKQVAEKLIEALENKMNWHHVAIRRYDPENDRLEVLAFNQPGLENEAQRQAVEGRFNELVSNSRQGLSGWVVRYGQAVRTGDVRTDNRYADTQPGVRSGLYVPIILSGHVVGVVSVESEDLNAFSESDERLLKTIANQAAVAFENARLFQNLQRELIERKQTEDALRKAESKYRNLVERLPVVVYTSELGMNGRWHYVSPQIESLLGFTPVEWMADPGLWYSQVHPDDRDRQTELEKQAWAHGEPYDDEYRILTRDGSVMWIRDTAIILPPQDAGAPIVQGTLIDITARKRAEEELLRSEARYRAVVENQTEFIVRWKPDGTRTFVNEAYLRCFGLTYEQAISSSFIPLVAEQDRRAIEEKIARLVSGSVTSETDVHQSLLPNGETVWQEWTDTAIQDEAGNLIEFQSVGRDITARKQAELEIRQRTQDLTLITTLNEAANRGESVETITNLFTQQAFSMFDCEDIAIYLITPDGEYLDMQNETLSSETRQKIEDFIGVSIPKIRLPIREGSYTQYVLSHTEGIVTDDPSEIQRWMLEFTETTFLPNVLRAPIRAIVPRIFHLLGIRSTMTIPLVTSGQTIGLMDFSSAKRFTGEDLQRMLPISRQMTAILLRKQAESKVEVQLRRITALNDIDRTIGSSFDMRLSLEVLLKEVVSQLEVDAADVLLINPVGMSLEYVAGKGFRTTNIRRSRLKLGQGLAGKVGLQQKILHIPNLRAMEDEFIRSPLLKGEGFVEYFGVPLLAKGALKGVLEIFNRTPLHPDPDWMNYLETLGGQAAIAVDNAELFESMQRSNQELAMAYDATIAGWSRAMDLRDKETEGHTQRVTELTTQLAERMGVDARELVHIRRGALLHDIGKLGVPDSILLKPAKLTDEEWEVMRQHPRYAYEMLLPINYLHPALDIPFAHHEKWDGSGYPRKLKAEQIPLAARLFAVVDVWDALRSDRPYREKWSVERTREYILEQSGKYFDPRVVNEFMRMLDEMPELNP